MTLQPQQALIEFGRGIASRAVVLGLWAYGCLGLASLIHLSTLRPAPSGLPWHLFGLAYGWWVAVSFVLLQVAIGRRLLGSWIAEGFGANHAMTRWLAEFTCGFWVSTVGLMLLGAVGLLDGYGLTLYLLGSAMLLLTRMPAGWRALRERLIPPLDRRLLVATMLALAILAVWLPFVVQSVLPNSDWDGASSHLPLATHLLAHGVAPISLDHANLIMPGNVHLVYAIFQAIGAEQAIIPLNLVVSVLTCLVAAAIASRFWGSRAGVWAFLVCLSTNILMELGLDPRVDGFLSFFCTVAALGIMVWLLERRRRGALVIAAMASGMALGVKYTAVFPVLVWSLPVLWILLREPDSRRAERKWALAIAVTCLIVPSGYWYASNAVRFGDPIYPRLSGDVIELKDGRQVRLSSAVDERIAEERNDPAFLQALEETTATPPEIVPPRTLFNPVSLFFSPELHARKAAHTLSPLLLLFVFLPLFRRDRAAWLLLWMGLSVYLAIGARTGLMRYGLPVYPLFALGAGAVIARITARWWQLAWATVLVVVLTSNLSAEWSKMRLLSPWTWLGGHQDRVQWLQIAGYSQIRAVPNLIAAMEDLHQRGVLPYDGGALLLGEAKTHLFPIESIPDTSRTGHPWLARLIRNDGDLEAIHTELWAGGVRYVLLNVDYFEWVRDNVRIDQEELVYSLFKLMQFQRTHGKIIFFGYGMYIIRLTPPGSQPAPHPAPQTPDSAQPTMAPDDHRDHLGTHKIS